MALADEESEARLQEIAERLVPLLPDGWKRATLTYQALGSFEVGILYCWSEAGHDWDTGRKLPQTDIYDLLRALRRDMYDPKTGTFAFFELALHAEPGGGFEWGNSFEGAEGFSWEDHVSAADCALQMRMFPAPDDLIPDWMRQRAGLHRVAEAFDPGGILARPQAESDLVALLPESIADIFARARLRLEEVVPGGAARLQIGRLVEGCWSVLHADTGWLAVGFGEDGQARAAAFGDVRSALAHAMAQIMAEEKVEINSELLEEARVLGRQRRPRVNEDAWHVGEPGGEIVRRTFHSPRPSGDAARDDSYIALDPLINRPGGYFVCRPGPPPETGPFVSVREVLEMLATGRLPKPPSPGRRRPEPRTEVLPVGTEVDAYEHHDQCFVFAIGTPEDRRGWFNRSKEPRYHVYRVAKPLTVYPGLFARLRLPGDEPPGERPGGEGQGYYLVDSIEDFVRSGHLVEIDRPGGDPIGSAGQ